VETLEIESTMRDKRDWTAGIGCGEASRIGESGAQCGAAPNP